MSSPSAGHGNEPDDDRTDAPPATQIGRLFHLSFIHLETAVAIQPRHPRRPNTISL